MVSVDQIKQRYSIRDVGRMVGIELPERDSVKFRSPWREDRNPSCTVYRERLHDHSSGEKWDAIDVYAEAKNLSIAEALKELGGGSVPYSEPPTKRAHRPDHDADREAQQVRKRDAWPDFDTPTDAEISRISELRGLSFEGVAIARERSLLFAADSPEGRCWMVSDIRRRNAQARRLDGQQWERIGAKAWTMPGSEASLPIGINESRGHEVIALCEGGPDMLAALHLAWCAGVEEQVAPVAMIGANLAIPDSQLPKFAGRRVRIFPHNDDSGKRAAIRWADQLRSVGAVVDFFEFNGWSQANGQPVGDLNDFVAIDPDEWERDRGVIELAFSFQPKETSCPE